MPFITVHNQRKELINIFNTVFVCSSFFTAVETIFLFLGPNNTEQSKIKCNVLFVSNIVFKDTVVSVPLQIHIFSVQHL